MTIEHEAPLCLICGEPAVRSFGSSSVNPLCPLYSCEQALIDEINLTVQQVASQNKEAS